MPLKKKHSLYQRNGKKEMLLPSAHSSLNGDISSLFLTESDEFDELLMNRNFRPPSPVPVSPQLRRSVSEYPNPNREDENSRRCEKNPSFLSHFVASVSPAICKEEGLESATENGSSPAVQKVSFLRRSLTAPIGGFSEKKYNGI